MNAIADDLKSHERKQITVGWKIGEREKKNQCEVIPRGKKQYIYKMIQVKKIKIK